MVVEEYSTANGVLVQIDDACIAHGQAEQCAIETQRKAARKILDEG